MTIKLHLVSHKGKLLDIFVRKLLNVVESNCKYVKIVRLPIKRRLFTVLKSPFVNKKSREQFSLETHKRLVIINNVNLGVFVNFFKVISCKGVAFKISLKGG
jgi:small subunit ribosomal protein S10|uniref:Ribosomal protein S10 n=1 Tax=Aureococcus anophagefferens TaxID=44056 RepID=A0A649UDT5_AURAN|nr:ribosomal protein S10 [Aureococcus anophagefferens]QQW50137.1 ribosomal protein S10 [Aureococcus anophagefferens]QQW50181.1 ribosomal protein S10 [Aureococcus anophagefferens]QQW50224.1 ribosomal protein S10 [Aureococcus anophagefferens]QQW50268.1 ribosomal protein S10 [Aureococcus anophagefferens]